MNFFTLYSRNRDSFPFLSRINREKRCSTLVERDKREDQYKANISLQLFFKHKKKRKRFFISFLFFFVKTSVSAISIFM